ncbi:LCP family protein [Ferrimicrobium acidiphilum]|uniref:LCP family protein n=1 Tax=Ferrimicrobium acidiphilum TaxID=121039 RepID=UPI0023F2DF3C|nr:LCP family protein [Ferrimicrobium acidiphilum]
MTHQHQKKVVRSAKLRRRRRLVTVLAGLLALILILGVGGYLYVHYRFNQIGRVNVNGLTVQAAGGKPENILLVGNNSRCTLQKYSSFYKKQNSHFGTCSQVGGGRSDVTMVLHLDPATHSAYLLSLPRDLWLPMPGGNGLELRIDDTLNSAEDSYLHLKFGPTMLVKAIQQDLGIPISHYVELNFYTFEKVVNTLGGITIDFPTALKDHYSGLNITKAGCQHLNGTQALALVRARHLYYYDPTTGKWQYDGTGDLGRIQRTHIFLRVLASEIKASALSNPINANALLGSILPALKVDQGFTLSDLVSLALTYSHVNPGAIPTATLPVIIPNGTFHDLANPSNYQAPGSIVLPYQPNDLTQISKFLGSSATNYQAVKPSSVTVSVLNGSGVTNEAAQTASALHTLGYKIASIGNATYAGSDSEAVVSYRPGDLAMGEKVLSSLTGQAIMAQGPSNQSADVVVTTGSTVAVTPPPSSSSSSSSSPSSTSSNSSSSTSGSSNLQSVTQLANTNLWNASQPASWWDPKACPAKS